VANFFGVFANKNRALISPTEKVLQAVCTLSSAYCQALGKKKGR
jgi:hypothetical protein